MTTDYRVTQDDELLVTADLDVAVVPAARPTALEPTTLTSSVGQPAAPGETIDGSSAGPGSESDSSKVTLLRQLLRPCGYFLFSRVTVLFAALSLKWLYPHRHVLNTLATGWDGSPYTTIARSGYPHGITHANGYLWAYFPSWPAAIRATATLTRLSIPDAALLASFIFGLASAVAVWLAVREVFGPRVADRSVLLYVFFPLSFVLSMAYTEGLFIAASAFCLFALSRRYWITASLFAALASLTRNFGFVLIACVAVAAIPAIWKERKVRPLVALAISPLGAMAWLLYCWWRAGTPLAFVKAETFWANAHFVFFLAPIASLARLTTGLHAFTKGADVLTGCAMVFIFLGLAVLWRTRHEGVRLPLAWWVFTVGSVLGAMSPYWTMSTLRYSMVIIPFFAAFAWKLRPSWMGPLVGMMATMQGALAVIVFIGAAHPHGSGIFP